MCGELYLLLALVTHFCYNVSVDAKRIIYIAMFTALSCVGAFISIPIPMTPIKMSFQTLFVILSGMVLGGRDGAISQIAYLIMGFAGLPVFTSGGGVGYVFMPSCGYLFGFVLGALVAGVLTHRLRTLSVPKIFLCAMCGLLPIYVIGISYQVLILVFYTKSTVAAAFATVPSVLILMVVDSIEIFLVCLIFPRLMTMMRIPNRTHIR